MTKHEAYAELIVSTVQKALAPALASLKAFGERLTAVEARPVVSPVEAELRETLAALRERMAVMETKSATIPAPVEVDLHPILARLQSAESALEAIKAEGLWHAGIQPLLADARERVAALEARPPVPGPKGDAGKDGVDGLGYDDMDFVSDEHGRPSLKFARGENVKTKRIPCIIDRGVYREGESYLKGDGVTYGGGFFIAQQDTDSKPEEFSGAWRLAVKRGRDGKDGKDAPSLPVVRVGGR